MLDNLRILTAQALGEGHSGLRVATEVAWLLGHPDAQAHWDTYELRVDLLAPQLPMTVMCGYDMRRCDPTGGRATLRVTIDPEQDSWQHPAYLCGC